MTQPVTREMIAAELRRKAEADTSPEVPVSEPQAPPSPGPGFDTYVPQVDAPATPEELRAGVRQVLRAASGGGTEAVNAAVQGAPAQAAAENTNTTAGGNIVDPARWAQWQLEANPGATAPGSGGGLATEHSTEQANMSGKTGKDPKAIAADLALNDSADANAVQGLAEAQAADRTQYERIAKVQENEFEATKAFKKQADDLQDNYVKERDFQLEHLKGIQKAMDAVPNAPRTIREKLDRAGVGTKIAFGLAAIFASAGNGAGTQRFLTTVQGNIDRLVQKESDEYAHLGKRVELSDNIYAHLRGNVKDDTDALNLTKSMYYDAAMHTVEQIATQYKMDMQSPQIQQLLEHLKRERGKLILDTANNIQQQSTTQVGTKQVPVPASKVFDKDAEEQVNKYGQEYEKRGGNEVEQAHTAFVQASQLMKESGFSEKESFVKAIAAIAASDDPAKQALALAGQRLSDPKELKALQLLIRATNVQIKDEAGKQVTKNELGRQLLAMGGYSRRAIENLIEGNLAKRSQVANAVGGTFGGPNLMFAKAYWARKHIAEAQGEHAGIGSAPPVPIDVGDVGPARK